MSEFSIEFYFDLQRFAKFTNGIVGQINDEDETGILSALFDSDGKAVFKGNATTGAGTLFWNTSALVSLSPAADNASGEDAGSIASNITIVSGNATSVKVGTSNMETTTGYVISEVTGVDIHDVAPDEGLVFGKISDLTLLNPSTTVSIGSNAVTFDGGGYANGETMSAFGDEITVGTRISVKGGEIANATMAAGENVTTANGMSAAFTNGGIATFANKSFGTINAFSTSDGNAALTVNDSLGGERSFLNASATATGVASLKSAITAVFSGQSLQSVKFDGKEASVVGGISFGGSLNLGRDISVQGAAINLSKTNVATSGLSSSISYYVGKSVGDSMKGSVLDLTAVALNDTDATAKTAKLTVSKTGNANYLIAKDYLDEEDGGESGIYNLTTINIGGVNYSFNDQGGTEGNGGVFVLDKGTVTGFVFREDGDSITIPKGTDLSKFKLYYTATSSGDGAVDYAEGDGEIVGVEEVSFNLEGNITDDWVITRITTDGGETTGFEILLYDSAELTASNDDKGTSVNVAFALPNPKDGSGRTSAAKITFDVNGVLQSVVTGFASTDSTSGEVSFTDASTTDTPNVGGTAINISDVKGDVIAKDDSGNTTFNINGVTANVSSNEIVYTVPGAKGQTENISKAIQLKSEKDTVGAVTDADGNPVKVLPYADGEGTIIYGTEKYEYTFTNANDNAYFYASGETLQFVFVDKGDSITIPEAAAESTTLKYVDKTDDEYTKYFTDNSEVDLPAVAVTSRTEGGSYTITMNTATSTRSNAAEFELSGLSEGAVVSYGEDDSKAELTYSAADGTFLFGKEDGAEDSNAKGFTAAGGTVTLNNVAAAFLNQADGRNNPIFEIDGTKVRIDAQVANETANQNQLVYNASDNGEKSLYGLGDGSTIYDAGNITKIYSQGVNGENGFTFAVDIANEDDDQSFVVSSADGEIDDYATSRAYFKVEGNKATGFVFAVENDQITSDDFNTIKLYDTYEDSTGFDAPVVTDANAAEEDADTPVSATIRKALVDYDNSGVEKDCYSFYGTTLLDRKVTFEDDTAVTFVNVDGNTRDTELLFSTTGKMLSILNLYSDNNEVIVENATDKVYIDEKVIDITGGGFTFRILEGGDPSIVDLKKDSNVKEATGVAMFRTISDDTQGNGTFTFGGQSFVIAGYSTSSDSDGVWFVNTSNVSASAIQIVGISSVEQGTSVTGALGGLALNGGASVLVSGGKDDQYTFSGTSFWGLSDGDKVTDAGEMTDFITDSDGAFEIVGTSMAIEGDSSVIFNVADDALTAIQDLAGTATGNFQDELGVNNETVKITGDSSVAVSGDNEVVTAIANVGGGSIALEQIGSASQVQTNADGVFDFVEAQQTFGTSSSDGLTFGIEDNKVTSITGIDQDGERVWGDFSNGISVDGNLLQVQNSEDITYVKGSHSGLSGVGIYGLKDGANVISASGLDVAVAVGQSGTYKFGEDQTFTIANDSNEHVGFLLENGKVTGIFDVDGEISGNLNGITINLKDPEIRVVGTDGENKDLIYSDGLLTGIKDGDTVQAADNVSTVRATQGGTFTFGSQSYTTDDADGVDFIVDKGTTNVIGIDGLADGAALTGALSGLSSINGQTVVVRNDSDFGVIGASAGIKEIFNVSGGAEVVYAGGASKVTTDKAGAFTIGGKSFTTALDDVVEFELDPQGQATGIAGLSGAVTSDGANFADFTVNGQSFAIAGDEDDLSVIGTSDEQGIATVAKVGGTSVAIIEAGGASTILTDKAGKFTFTKAGQSFSTTDDALAFDLNPDEKVTDIEFLDGDITGNFTDVDSVNTKTVRVTDSDNILTISGQGASTITKISDVDADATITNVGGASQVITKTAGSFSFAGHVNPFEISGDDVITFDMVEGADAQVRGITGIDDGAVTGNLSDLEAINGQSFIVDNDEDNKFTYEKNGSAATVSGVGGDAVDIQALAGASTVELEKDGTYTFGTKAYEIATGGSATIGVNDLTVTSIDGLDQDGESVIGDFTSNIKLGDKNFNVTGDSSVTVAQEDGKLVISGLNDGAKIVAADSVSKATTEEAGTFSDTDDRTLTIGNGDALLSLDGAAHIIGVSGVTDGIGGDISGLPIGGSSAVVNVISAPDGEPSSNVNLNGDTLSGVVANDTIISAGPATLVVADGADGSYQFGIGSDAKRFDIIDDTNGVLEFAVGGTSNTVVSAVSDIDEGAILVGELNGVAVNGVNVSVTGDSDNIFGVIGDASGGISALINVGGGSNGVTVMSAGGADEVITSTEGKFTFNGSGQKFTVAGDSSVSFDIEGNAGQESVTAVKDLDGTVAGDFSNAIAVNDGTIQVTGDKDGVLVVGAQNAVAAINDVDAGASVVSSGDASVVGAYGEGVYTFVEGNERFTIAGDTALNFNLDNGDVIGVDSFQRVGTDRALITFDPTTTPTLEINPTVNDPVAVSAASGVLVTVEVDAAGKIVGVAGVEEVEGLENATINATGPITVNGKEFDIVDADNSYNVGVKDFEADKVTAVTGNATVNVADAVIEANKDGEFQINGASYTIVDGDNNFALTTDPSKNLSAVSSLDGAIIVEDGTDDLNINGNDVAFANGGTPVTVYSDGTNITAVEGLVDGATISGALDNASIAMASVAANDANNMSILTVNDTLFALIGPDASSEHSGGYNVADLDGVTINGKGEIVGLDDGARMIATEAGVYTVNGSTMSAVPGDTIFGAGEEGAYVYDPDNILVRKSTPISTIESLTGISALADSVIGSYADPAAKASLDSILADSAVDKDRVLDIYTTNDSDTVAQDIDLSPYGFSKKVHLFNGEQNLAFNNAGGNLAHVEETYRAADGNDSLTSGKKNIVLGDGGDVAVVDMAHDIGNEVNIVGGASDDSIIVRNNVATTINMSAGGADKVVTFAGANGRIALEGYNASTGAGVQFDHLSLRDAKGGIANAIENGVIGFGDGVVSLTTSAGNTQISLNGATGGTDSLGGSVVNLFTPEGTRQQVAFTHSAGGVASVDATSTEDVIFIGNKDGRKEGGSVLRGGMGNDVAFAGEGDAVDLGDGLNVVRLQDNAGREGAFVNIAAGANAIYGANNTLNEIHGDTLGVDLTQMELSYVNGNLIVNSKDNATISAYATIFSADQDGTLSYDSASTLAQSADLAESADDSDTTGGTSTATTEESVVAAAITSSLAPDHNYTNQLINSNGTLIKAAIGATGSVMDVKLDEDVRANYYVGDDSGLTFYGYNGDVLIDLEGDWQASRIDQQGVAVEGITSIAAGTGLNYIKGSDENETFFAGRGNSHLYGDGGRNLLVGYEGLDKEGQTTFYLLGNAYDAANTISGFEFVDDNNYDNNNKITADKLEVDLPTNYVNRVELSNDDVVINVTGRNGISTESAVIVGAKGKDILVSGDGIVADVVAQIGDDTLTFDKFANYYNAKGKNATVVVDQNNQMDYARVWLDNASLTGTTFVGDIHEINASLYSGAAELAGNDYNNTIIAGSGATSLWGGNRGDDALVAGTGQDTFYYTLGNGTDTIYGAKDGDVVNLAGVKLSDIVGAEYSEIGVALNFRDGGKLYIGDNGGNDVSYVVEGQTYFVNENHNGFVKKA